MKSIKTLQKNKELQKVIFLIIQNGGNPFLVGGSVRDLWTGKPIKDFDIEVFGLDMNQIIDILKAKGDVNEVGKSFGVIKFKLPNGKIEFDISVPRTENKIGESHKDFSIQLDSKLSLLEASKRRDFTFNAMFLCLTSWEVIDLHDGIKHLKEGIIECVDNNTFVEDSLRVLRAFQFISRFGFTPSANLIELSKCLKEDLRNNISPSRFFEEFTKFSKGLHTAKALQFLQDADLLDIFGLEKMPLTNQNPEWHPEGNVWEHTKLVCGEMSRLIVAKIDDDSVKTILMLSALLHDLGKVETTIERNGVLTAHGHEQKSVEMLENFFKVFGTNCPNDIKKVVNILVGLHGCTHSMVEEPTQKTLNRILFKLNNVPLEWLGMLVEADKSGRFPKPKGQCPKMQKLLELNQVKDCVNPMERLVTGKDLLNLGWKPGVEMGTELNRIFEMQLDCVFKTKEEGLELVKSL